MIGNIDKIFGDNSKTDDSFEIGIGYFTAFVKESESIQLTSDVPDNYVEDGSVINDHIINNPIVLNFEGEVSDIHIKAEFSTETLFAPIDKAANILNNIVPISKTQQMLQKAKAQAQKISDAYNKVEDALRAGANILSMFEDEDADTTQQRFFRVMNNIYYSKELIKIETPFKVYENMRITSITIIRDNKTDQALKFKISAKEVRFAETILEDKNKFFKNPTGSVSDKVKDKANKGSTSGEKVPKSFLDETISTFKG